MTDPIVSEPIFLKIVDAHRLNHETGDAYPESLHQTLPDGPISALAVDMSSVELLSSRGLRILVNLKRRVERGQGRFMLCRLKPTVRDQLRRIRLSNHFPSAPGPSVAMDSPRSVPSL